MRKSKSYLLFVAASLFAANLSCNQAGGQSGLSDLQSSFALDAPTLGAQEQPPQFNAVGAPAQKPVPPEEPFTLGATDEGDTPGIVQIPQPVQSYRDRTTLFPITQPDLTIITSLTAGGCTVTFSPPVQVRTVGLTWGSWGSPPDTEGALPRILYSFGATQLTMTFSGEGCIFGTFGFEAEPNPFLVLPMMASFRNGTTQVGSIMRDVDGFFGALLFAADSAGLPFTSVVFSSVADFGIAQLRYELGGAATLQGRVTEFGTGAPIAGATVRAVGPVTRTGITDSGGNYTVHLQTGLYDVTASAYGYLSKEVFSLEAQDGVTTTHNFVLSRATTRQVSGTVRVEGAVAAGAEVRILNTPLPPTTTDAAGMYSFAAVAVGTYTIQVSATTPAFIASFGRCFATQTRVISVGITDVVANIDVTRRRDAFGYTCNDMIPFNYIPGDTLSPLTGDDVILTILMPFPMRLYGIISNYLHISTNGNLNFTLPIAPFVSTPIPGAVPHGMIAPFWDDLTIFPEEGSHIYTKLMGDAPNRQFIVEWRDARFFGFPTSVVTCEAILSEADGSIIFQYNRTDVRGDGRNATIGIEDDTGTVGFQYTFHEASVGVGKAIKFIRP